MKINKLMTYDDVIKKLNKEKREKHLLLGNGFSRAFDDKIFSYNALSNFITNIKNPVLQKLFTVINTKNFELIMSQLENFIEIAKELKADKDFIKKIEDANKSLKDGLIEAVKSLHPEHVFKISEEKCLKCADFLNEYLSKGDKIFSTNYDLLLYWVTMRMNFETAIDGFGKDVINYESGMSSEELEYSDLRWGKYKDTQAIFYLHGALQIFDNGIDIEKEQYNSQQYLLEKIKERMDSKDYPIFVTAGNGTEKLNHIMHNKYLSFCYDKFADIKGSLVTFGFNFGPYDDHIIKAINKAAKYGKRVGDQLFSIYIGVYSDEGLEHIEKIENSFKIYKLHKFNARTARVWD